jgi:hypothetical protein
VDLYASAVTATVEKNIFYWCLFPNGTFYEMSVVPRRNHVSLQSEYNRT